MSFSHLQVLPSYPGELIDEKIVDWYRERPHLWHELDDAFHRGVMSGDFALHFVGEVLEDDGYIPNEHAIPYMAAYCRLHKCNVAPDDVTPRRLENAPQYIVSEMKDRLSYRHV